MLNPRNQTTWACPRCKTTNAAGVTECESCGSDAQWTPPQTPRVGPTPEQELEDRLNRERQMAEREAADIEHRERVRAIQDMSRRKLDETLANRIDAPVKALQKRCDDMASEILELRAEIRSLKQKGASNAANR